MSIGICWLIALTVSVSNLRIWYRVAFYIHIGVGFCVARSWWFGQCETPKVAGRVTDSNPRFFYIAPQVPDSMGLWGGVFRLTFSSVSGIGGGGTPSGGSVGVAPKHNLQRTVIYCERIFIHLIPVLLSGSHGSFFADYCKDRMLHYCRFPFTVWFLYRLWECDKTCIIRRLITFRQ